MIETAQQYFPNIYQKAKTLKEEHSVKKYVFNENNDNHLYLVVGRNSQYLVSECHFQEGLTYSCSCPDFFYQSLIKSRERRRSFCHHILAVMMREKSTLEEGKDEQGVLYEEGSYLLDLLSELQK